MNFNEPQHRRKLFPLWPGPAPGALGDREADIPSLTPYLPRDRPAGTAIVVCPGGGYSQLAPHEGHDYALWLNGHGIAAFVLKYRLAPDGYHHPAMLHDAARAVRLIRSRVAEFGIQSDRIGIMGSSAGGHLAATLLTHFSLGEPSAADAVERESSRPDFGILCYPVITTGPFAHSGSIGSILGPNPDPLLRATLSLENQVCVRTPPCFIWHTVEDEGVPVENSLLFAGALRRESVAFDLHLYEKGRHGLGLDDQPPFARAHPWSAACLFWLKRRGLVR